MEGPYLFQLEIVILVGAVVAIVARRLRVPYTVGLLVAGIVLATFGVDLRLHFSRDLLFNILLPPLIFEAALYIKWNELRPDLKVIGTFATLGVISSAAVTAVLMHFAAGWAIEPAILFGILIAATDPVSVIATFKQANVEGRVRLLVESESLFNDGTAAVAFAVALTIVQGSSVSVTGAVWVAAVAIFGGVGCGLLIGIAVYLVIGRTEDHLVELAMTSVAAFGSFWLAEYSHMSGILATTAAGLLLGNLRHRGTITRLGEEYILSFWDFAAFVANTVIFLLLGITAVNQDLLNSAWLIAIAIAAVLIGRAAAVYPCAALFRWSSRRITARHQHILFWGGLRGALALGLALTIPDTTPYKSTVLAVTFGVVAFSVLVQGTTIERWAAKGS